MQAVVDDWIDAYNKNKKAAMVDLLQFFVQCCGCNGEWHSPDTDTICSEVV